MKKRNKKGHKPNGKKMKRIDNNKKKEEETGTEKRPRCGFVYLFVRRALNDLCRSRTSP
jgi:hypothetical protein